MSDTVVQVAIDSQRVQVSIDLKAPVITITNNITGSIATVQANQVATVAAVEPIVNVFMGGVANYNNQQILNLLANSLTRAQLGASLVIELDDTISTLAVHTNAIDTAEVDIVTHTSQFGIVDNQIVALTGRVTINEGDIDIAETAIIQNADNILLHAGRLTTNEGAITAAEASINLNSVQIALNVSDISNADGVISANTASILINAQDITSAVNRITDTEGDVVTHGTTITQNADAIIAQAIIVDAHGVTIAETTVSVLAQGVLINTVDGNLTAQTAMLADKWSVTLIEDPLGNPYSTGFALSLHENWASDHGIYNVDDMVWYDGAAWKCILQHTAQSSWYPQEDTRWTAVTTEDKSNFRIHVDNFEIQNTAGDSIVTPFQVTGGVVTIDGSLIADTIQSSDYVAGTSGFTLDIDTGIVEINHLEVQMSAVDGSKITVGDDNVIIDSVTNSIIVAPDGGINDSNPYAQLTSGELIFFDYYDSAYHQTRALKSMANGYCTDGQTVNVGYFRNAPTIIISPKALDCYNPTYSNQIQKFVLDAANIRQSGNDWLFDTMCQLQISSNSLPASTPPQLNATGLWYQNNPSGYQTGKWFGPFYGTEINTGITLVRSMSVDVTAVGLTSSYYPPWVGYVDYHLEVWDGTSWISSSTVRLTTDQDGESKNSTLVASATADITKYRIVFSMWLSTIWTQDITLIAPPYGYIVTNSATMILNSALISLNGTANYLAVGD